MKYLISSVCFFAALATYAGTIDSLENQLKTAQGVERVKVMNELFRAYISSDPIAAVGYTREAMILAEKIGDKKGMAASFNNLGVAYRNQGALDLALANYLKSLELYTTLQNAEGIATTKNNIATIYSMKRNYSQALTFYEESNQGFVALGNTDQIIGSMNNLGNLHSDLQLYDKALTYYTDAWKLAEKAGITFVDPLVNIGSVYYRQGNYQRAGDFYQQALELVRKQGNRSTELSILSNLGEMYEKAAQPKQAQKYLDDALALAAELQANYMLPQILKSMSANFARQGKMKEAYETLLKYDGAREKVFGEESTRRITQMDMALQLQEKENALEELQLSDQNKTLKLRNAQIIIVAGVLALIIGIAGFNMLYWRKRRQPQ
ncbi:MAG: tetratricopeptide repeat protein [Cyclobacteriaceae bacterium]|nr:tetratricopeptide repeat protein [Cyclobacteriaceae bacterium]